MCPFAKPTYTETVLSLVTVHSFYRLIFIPAFVIFIIILISYLIHIYLCKYSCNSVFRLQSVLEINGLLLLLLLLLFLCFSSSFYNSVTSNGIILQSTSFGKSGHYFIYCRDRPSYSTNRPITIWNKHGFMCSLPANDLTICVDIERNPGPLCSSLNNIIHSATNLVHLLDLIVSNSNVRLLFHSLGTSFSPFVIWASSVVHLHF